MAKSSPMYANDVPTITHPWSTGSPSVAPLHHHGNERDQQGPGDEEVRVKDRDAEDRRAHVEEREQRVVEEQHAQQEQAGEPGAACGLRLHPSSSALGGALRAPLAVVYGTGARSSFTRATRSFVEKGLVT